ncbi:nucleoside deaminase [Vibrio maerlii]|uniref:nucleoside deaminase n=1 Tax=Vibrio maerlii TaxID=2231648 RepID=UPI000E3DF40F|nr:nucleoside deaminase [Vibrio maerlii]
MSASQLDIAMLKKTIAITEDIAEKGIHPFAALLVDKHGNVLMEQVNAYLPDHDMTGHAERVLMTRASKTWSPDFLSECTMYVSAEPCCMCAGAAYWAGIGRVVYACSEHRLKQITGNHPENPTLDLPCRTVFESGQREVEVIGPLLEEEAAKVHLTFWSNQQVATEMA